MSGREVRHEVTAEEEGQRLDRVLADLVGSRAQAQKAIRDGRVLVGGREVAKSRAVAAGEELVVQLLESRPTQLAETHDVPVVHRDDQVVVVDKPAGLVVHPAPGHRGRTLVELLAGQTAGGPEDRPGVVHRLDRETSGLLVLARTDDALRTLQQAIADREVRREYVALVQGTPPARTGTIEAPIGRDPRDRTRMAVDGESPRDAVTHFEVTEHLERHTLLRVVLETGRTHQIRVHLEAIGHPVVGDPAYGEGPELGLERQFLHAERLRFDHPETGEPLDLRAPLPDELQRALIAARGPA